LGVLDNLSSFSNLNGFGTMTPASTTSS
jgi:hypothetical protein